MDGGVVQERRLHPAGMLIAALKTIRSWIGLAAFPGIAALINGQFGMRTILLVILGVVVLAAFSAVWGVLAWRATTYRVEGGTLHLKSGVLQKNERSLPLEHVQSVNTVQGVVQRVFGVVELKVEAAGGSGGAEISLPALSRDDARALREELTRARRKSAEETQQPLPTVLRRISNRDLLIAGLTSGQIGVAASVVFGLSQVLDDVFPGNVLERVAEIFLPRTLVAAILLVALVVALSAWVLAILGTVLAHAGFTLSRSADGKYLHIKRGLLNRYETAVPLARVQAIKVVEGVLRQPFGLAALRVESAGFGEEEGVSTILFPLLPRREVEDFLRIAAPLFAVPLDRIEGLPPRARRRYAFRGALPFVIPAAVPAIVFFPWGMLALLVAVPGALYGLLRYRTAGWGMEDDRVVLRFRRLARTTAVAPRGRLQSRGFSVTPFQKRLGLATFGIEVASGRGGSAFGITDLARESAVGLVAALSARASSEEAAAQRRFT